jgi:hypothetical protein
MSDQEPSTPSAVDPRHIDPEELFAQWEAQDADEDWDTDRNTRFSVSQYPWILIVIASLAVALSWHTWPAMESLINQDDYEQCGTVLERAMLKQKGTPPFAFKHLQRCELEGVVQHLNLFAIGVQADPDHKDMFQKNLGVSYVSKLNGDHIFAILPAHEPWVEGYRLKNGSLFGLEIEGRGLMIHPTEEPTYQRLERQLRLQFDIKLDQDLWFFDLTYSPWDHKMPLITFVLSPMISVISIIGFLILNRRKRKRALWDLEEIKSFEGLEVGHPEDWARLNTQDDSSIEEGTSSSSPL